VPRGSCYEEELRGASLGGRSFGDFDQAVNIAIGKLRSALGDSAENPRYTGLFQNVAIASLRCRLSLQTTAPKGRICGWRYTWDRVWASAQSRVDRCAQTSTVADAPVIVALTLVLSLPILAVWLIRSRGRAHGHPILACSADNRRCFRITSLTVRRTN
jgi:hypothetical protein